MLKKIRFSWHQKNLFDQWKSLSIDPTALMRKYQRSHHWVGFFVIQIEEYFLLCYDGDIRLYEHDSNILYSWIEWPNEKKNYFYFSFWQAYDDICIVNQSTKTFDCHLLSNIPNNNLTYFFSDENVSTREYLSLL